MRISLRLIILLIVGVTFVALLFAYSEVKAEQRALRSDLQNRAQLLADSLAQSVELLLERGDRRELHVFVDRFGNRERLAGVVVYDEENRAIAMTSGLADHFAQPPEAVLQAVSADQGVGAFFDLGPIPMHVYSVPLDRDGKEAGALAIFHDASYINKQGVRLWRSTFLRVLVQTVFIALATLLLIRSSFLRPIAKTAQWIHEL